MLEIVPDEPQKAGEIVAHRYRLERVVGEGGMGVVWAATHVLTGKPCALKFLKASRAADPRSHSRLLHEARAVCRVRHPNVAPVHDILELASGVPFIVMDLLDGEPLSAKLRREGRLSWNATAEILVPTVDAILAAHEQRVVHRDLKPDNVFLERGADDRVEIRVLDFGIAKSFDLMGETVAEEAPKTSLPTQGLTTTHSFVGTPSYMAPEQISHATDVGPAADVWSLGVIAYECLTGARPERDPDTHGAARTAADELRSRAPTANAEAVALVMSMLEVDPASRISAVEARARLRALRAPAERSKRRVFFAAVGVVVVVAIAGVAAAKRDAPHVDAPLPDSVITAASITQPTPAAVEPSVASAAASTEKAAVDLPSADTSHARSPGKRHAATSTAPSSQPAAQTTADSNDPSASNRAAAPAGVSSVTVPSYDRK